MIGSCVFAYAVAFGMIITLLLAVIVEVLRRDQ